MYYLCVQALFWYIVGKKFKQFRWEGDARSKQEQHHLMDKKSTADNTSDCPRHELFVFFEKSIFLIECEIIKLNYYEIFLFLFRNSLFIFKR